MAKREVSIVIFYDTNGNVAVQERGLHSKIGEKYGYGNNTGLGIYAGVGLSFSW